MMKLSLMLLALAAFLSASDAAQAHSDRSSFEETKGGYAVDIGYGEAAAGETLRLDFDIKDDKGREAAWSSVWVRIERKGNLVFSGPIGKTAFGATNMNIAIEDQGEYDVHARFEHATRTLVEASFKIDVSQGDRSDRAAGLWQPIVYLCLVAGGAVIGWFLKPRSLS